MLVIMSCFLDRKGSWPFQRETSIRLPSSFLSPLLTALMLQLLLVKYIEEEKRGGEEIERKSMHDAMMMS